MFTIKCLFVLFLAKLTFASVSNTGTDCGFGLDCKCNYETEITSNNKDFNKLLRMSVYCNYGSRFENGIVPDNFCGNWLLFHFILLHILANLLIFSPYHT